ncbi:MAG: hypothetical protein KDD63_06175, partial [Bacteroidetes bacterium]|nr:hypothetical protein [Bacteroidota bacterium]
SREISSPTTIRVKDRVTRIPVSSHLDFFGANGLYYWEMFFHAPFLIAQTFNTEQKFEEAKEWYEYIYDPTAISDYWKFLPFLSIDVKALIQSITARLEEYQLEASKISLTYNQSQHTLEDLLSLLRTISISETQTALELVQQLNGIFWSIPDLPKELEELLSLVGQLPVRYLPENHFAQIEAYLNDPFDPHSIANLRYVAYQKSIVMAYIDNLLDWGDMHFSQYTGEDIDEARMLYLLAYNLLGHRPENLGTLVLSEEASLEQLINQSPDYDFLLELEDEFDVGIIHKPGTSTRSVDIESVPELGTFTFDPGSTMGLITTVTDMASFNAAKVHDSVANSYFFIPENPYFIDYWNRVEDRL